MKARTRKAIDRMLARTVPTSPDGVRWYQRANLVRFVVKNPRQALRRARRLVDEARPLMTPYQIKLWQKI